MVRTVLALSVMVLLAVTAGCKMCADPYDDCGPTFTGEYGEECDPDFRAGSILAPGIPTLAQAEIGAEIVEENWPVLEEAPTETVPDADGPLPVLDDTVGTMPGVEEPINPVAPRGQQRWVSRPRRRL